jgi:uncharacterized membrane protein
VRLEERITVRAPQEKLWEFLSDTSRYPSFMYGITRWDVDGEHPWGLGARYSVRMKVGTAHVGGVVEVVEFDEGREVAWTSVTGVDQRGRWRLRGRGPAQTEVTLRLSFTLAGGFLSRLVERIASRMVRDNLHRSLLALKVQVEGGVPPTGEPGTEARAQ